MVHVCQTVNETYVRFHCCFVFLVGHDFCSSLVPQHRAAPEKLPDLEFYRAACFLRQRLVIPDPLFQFFASLRKIHLFCRIHHKCHLLFIQISQKTGGILLCQKITADHPLTASHKCAIIRQHVFTAAKLFFIDGHHLFIPSGGKADSNPHLPDFFHHRYRIGGDHFLVI